MARQDRTHPQTERQHLYMFRLAEFACHTADCFKIFYPAQPHFVGARKRTRGGKQLEKLP